MIRVLLAVESMKRVLLKRELNRATKTCAKRRPISDADWKLLYRSYLETKKNIRRLEAVQHIRDLADMHSVRLDEI